MPERLDFVALLEGPEGGPKTRVRLIEGIRNRLSHWIGDPQEVFWLGDKFSSTMPWTDASSLIERDLHKSDLLFIYFAAKEAGQYIVLSLQKKSQAIVYNLSLPSSADEINKDVASNILSELYQEMSALNIHCIVAAGYELEVDEDCESVENVIRSTGKLDSLVALLCCDKNDARGLDGFVPLADLGDRAIYLRRVST